MGKLLTCTLMMTAFAFPLYSQVCCEGDESGQCGEDSCLVFEDEELAYQEPCVEYYPDGYCHRRYWYEDAPSRDIDADWPGKIHDSFFDELSR